MVINSTFTFEEQARVWKSLKETMVSSRPTSGQPYVAILGTRQSKGQMGLNHWSTRKTLITSDLVMFFENLSLASVLQTVPIGSDRHDPVSIEEG